MRNAILGFLGGLILAGVLVIVFYKPKPLIEHITTTDTVYTERLIEKTRVLTRTDTVLVYRLDTIRDTLYYEQKRYLDTITTDSTRLALRIDFSGYNAKLDTVSYSLLVEQPKASKRRLGHSLTIGPSIGYGIGLQNPTFQPYIGISLTYGLSWNF